MSSALTAASSELAETTVTSRLAGVHKVLQARLRVAAASMSGARSDSGTDWNPVRRQFSADCSFQRFDRPFGRNEGWQVDLQPTIAGNASTTEVEAY